MRYYGESGEVDGLLADLGVSSHHFDDKDSRFLFPFHGTLDMRMNTRSGQTAADIVNNYTAEALADVFYLYGELKVSRKLASVLVKARETKKIETIEEPQGTPQHLFQRPHLIVHLDTKRLKDLRQEFLLLVLSRIILCVTMEKAGR